MISKVCGGGNGTACGDVVGRVGLSGAAEDLCGSGVTTVGDLEVIVD